MYANVLYVNINNIGSPLSEHKKEVFLNLKIYTVTLM